MVCIVGSLCDMFCLQHVSVVVSKRSMLLQPTDLTWKQCLRQVSSLPREPNFSSYNLLSMHWCMSLNRRYNTLCYIRFEQHAFATSFRTHRLAAFAPNYIYTTKLPPFASVAQQHRRRRLWLRIFTFLNNNSTSNRSVLTWFGLAFVDKACLVYVESDFPLATLYHICKTQTKSNHIYMHTNSLYIYACIS